MGYLGFNEMLERISPVLKNIVLKFTGWLSIADLEDLLAEARMHLWTQYRKGALIGKTDSYILQGCYFHLRNYMRTKSVKLRDESLEKILQDDDYGDIPELGYVEKYDEDPDYLQVSLLLDGMYADRITGRQAEVIEMYGDGHTTREIAERFGISHVMVSKLIGSALGVMRLEKNS